MNKKTSTIVYLSVLTALYVVLSAFLKIPLGVGNIMLDLGYIAFTVALGYYNEIGTIGGVLGCALESILFSVYGFSISWAVANLIIGLGCGFAFRKSKKIWVRIVAIIIFTALGLLGAKTIIECALYNIPLLVKIPKNAVAFITDCVVMIIGLIVFNNLKKIRKN